MNTNDNQLGKTFVKGEVEGKIVKNLGLYDSAVDFMACGCFMFWVKNLEDITFKSPKIKF